MNAKCPTCGATHPKVETVGCTGKSWVIVTFNVCRGCGTSFRESYDCTTRELKAEILAPQKQEGEKDVKQENKDV